MQSGRDRSDSWSPLARGRLTRDWQETSTRSESDQFAKLLYSRTEEADRLVALRVKEIAEERGLPRAQVALAWVLQKKPVTAPIVGATSMSHLEDAAAAVSVTLSPEDVLRLEEPYIPHPVMGY